MHVQRRRHVAVHALLVLVGGLILSACSATAFAEPGGVSADAEQHARAKWDQRPFTRYRLVVQHTQIIRGNQFTCQSDQIVRNRRIRHIFENNCLLAENWTVELLFDRAALPNRRTCDSAAIGGCACVRSLETQVNYDDQLGYPVRIERRTGTFAQWWHLDYWLYLIHEQRQPWCAQNNGSFVQILSVESLEPQ